MFDIKERTNALIDKWLDLDTGVLSPLIPKGCAGWMSHEWEKWFGKIREEYTDIDPESESRYTSKTIKLIDNGFCKLEVQPLVDTSDSDYPRLDLFFHFVITNNSIYYPPQRYVRKITLSMTELRIYLTECGIIPYRHILEDVLHDLQEISFHHFTADIKSV